jgi:hypothetical protein
MTDHSGSLGAQSTMLAILLVVEGVIPEVAWAVAKRTEEMFTGKTLTATMTFEELRTLAEEFA